MQLHVGFFRGPAGFAAVARGAGADDVFPGMRPAAVTRHHMVEGQLPGLFTAVLTGELVAVINFSAADLTRDVVRAFNQVRKPDDRWYRHVLIGRMNITIAIFQHLSSTLVKKR